MEEVSFIMQVLSLLVLLTISSFTYILSKKINFPYTVLLVLIGLLLVPISHIEIFGFINDFKLTPDILFYVFLPILLFEAAYNINYRQLLKNWKTIAGLSIFGLIISAVIIAVSIFFILPLVGFKIPFLVCLLFGALISATDPVAVLSIFKSMGAPRRLTILFEGESLFNDGTAVALFAVILAVIIEGGNVSTSTYFEGTWKFLSMLFGGIIFGGFTGIFFSKIIGYIKNNEEVEITMTMVLAHITFISAELITHNFEFLPISGVIATVVASIIVGNYGRYKITPRVEAHMQKFWEFFAFVSNSLVFILMGLILSSINVDFTDFIVPLFITIPIVMFARLVSVYIPVGVINTFKLEEKIPYSWMSLLSWGSLRGALALMMVLMIPGVGETGYEGMIAFQNIVGWDHGFSIKDFLLVITIGSIMFTLFVKAPTISMIMKSMKVDKLHKLEMFEYEEGKILANLKILAKLDKSHKKAYLTITEYEELKFKYTSRLNKAVKDMKAILADSGKEKSATLIKRALSLHALGIEKQYLKELFLYNEIDERNFKYILRKIEKQMERVESDNPQIKNISNISKDYDIFSKLAIKMYHNASSPIDTYIRNRTRVVITRKVIAELKMLSEIEFGFDNHMFDDLISLYAGFHKFADEKRISILKHHKLSIMSLESNIVNKSLLKLEEKVLKDLYNKEIITPKLYIKFMEEVEKELYKDVKNIDFNK